MSMQHILPGTAFLLDTSSWGTVCWSLLALNDWQDLRSQEA